MRNGRGEPGVCPHCHSRSFYIHANKEVVCSQCGIRGVLREGENDYTFEFPESEIELAHDEDYKSRVKALAEEFPAMKPDTNN